MMATSPAGVAEYAGSSLASRRAFFAFRVRFPGRAEAVSADCRSEAARAQALGDLVLEDDLVTVLVA